ncbi:ATP-binding protein [Streptacidiphilus anmyonensis]|uniref:ATP-binding protein n=1 Tax=Streptacidiphilus anmyonensis TaxID=405782 RepID=UPI0007C81DD6|nr:helix-turn-helix domain-containing protein [Streptacidiphilus anmyonensis]
MGTTEFGRLLREERQRALLTLESLAEASGVSARAISDMERGRSTPRMSTLTELLDALDLDTAGRRRLLEAAGRPSTPETSVPRQLPPDLRAFRGRSDVLEAARALTDRLGAGAAQQVLITAVAGMAGVGKTTLAVHWAHRVADGYPDGQLYVNLRGFDPGGNALDPGEALGGFLVALGVPAREIPEGTAERGALFRERTAALRLLVVLDNARDADQVRPLLPEGPGCLALVTSRSQLTGLAALDSAAQFSLDVWTPDEALDALRARIGDERVEAEPDSAAALVELCGRLPLAVAVMAAQLGATPVLSLRAAAADLRDPSTRLDTLEGADPRTDVRAVFSWSYRALDAEAARFFRYLAVHPGPAMSAESAASVAGVPLRTARRLLRRLTSANLLSRDAEGRHLLHDLLRDYACELLEQEREDRFAAETRLLHYLHFNADSAGRVMSTRTRRPLTQSPAEGVVLLPFDDRPRAIEWFRGEEDTILAALHAISDPRFTRARLLLADDSTTFLDAQGRWADEITLLRVVLDAALVLDDPGVITAAAGGIARALAQLGRAQEADEQVELMEHYFGRLDPEQLAHTRRSIGWVLGRQGRHEEALEQARAALALYRTLPDENLVARELNAVAWYSALLGDFRTTISRCEEALPILRRTGNQRSEAATWDTLGFARLRLGETEVAIGNLRRALDLYRLVHDLPNQAEVLDHLAEALLERGEPDAARAAWTEAAELLSGVGSAEASRFAAKADAVGATGPTARTAPTEDDRPAGNPGRRRGPSSG